MAKAAQVHEVTPHVGIGPLRLGMTPAEVRAAVPGHAVEKAGRGREEMIDSLGLTVDYSEAGAAVTFIQAFPADGVRFTFRGIDVFSLSADDVVAAVIRQEGLDPAGFPPGRHDYLFPTLRLGLWRGVVPDGSGEPGWEFESVSVHTPEYYEA